MKDIIPAKKQSPILGLTGMGGGLGSNIVAGGGGGEKTYVDEVFSTYIYDGNATARTITNGIDLSGKGGLVWTKARDTATAHNLIDTVRGNTQRIRTSSDGSSTTITDAISAFNDNGYGLAAEVQGYGFNLNNINYNSWTFRKQKGYFDIVTFQQSGADSQTTPQVVPHNLGVAPGMILLKKTNGDRDWFVYHRDLGKDYWIKFNEDGVAVNENNSWGTTTPDANNFGYMSGYIGGGGGSAQFVAYLFGGGSSTAAGAHSVYWPSASGQTRRVLCGNASNTTADFNFGTGDLTIECWIKCSTTQGTYPRVVAIGPQWATDMAAIQWDHDNTANRVSFYCYNHSSDPSTPLLKSSTKGFNNDGQYHHVAVTRSGSKWRLFVDGFLEDIASWSGSTNTANSYCTIGNTPGTATTAWFGGYISNVRVVKGTAVYTDSFKPSTKPLTSVTNTKLLCCNNLSATAATVTPISLTEEAVMQNQTDNPFDDPGGYKFGEEGDQNIVKTGSYIGNGSSNGPEIYLGWEPQFLLFKNANGNNQDWRIYDSMRGWVTGGSEHTLKPNTNHAEATSQNFASITPTGFKVVDGDGAINGNGNKIIYMAIRRSDGYVGKQPETASELFNMSLGSGTSYCHTAGFPVDFAIYKSPASNGSNWWTSNRLTQGIERRINLTALDSAWAPAMFDSMTKWMNTTQSATTQSYMWKRHAGFDVVTYDGNGVSGRSIFHSMNKTPEMIWLKRRTGTTRNWPVYHKGLNGGSVPQEYTAWLNLTNAEQDETSIWNDTAPNSSHFTVGNSVNVNEDGATYLAMLFASVDGICKCGYYDGTGSEFTVTTGFQPRFVIIKAYNNTRGWTVLDTQRGWGAGVDNKIYLNDDVAQVNTWNYGEPTSTGFKVSPDPQYDINYTGWKYIYYAHA